MTLISLYKTGQAYKVLSKEVKSPLYQTTPPPPYKLPGIHSLIDPSSNYCIVYNGTLKVSKYAAVI